MLRKNSASLILGIIIGLVISLGGVYATTQLTATDIDIDKSNSKLKNVSGNKIQDALEYLYARASNISQCPVGYKCSVTRNPGYLPENDNTTYTQSTFVQNLQVGNVIKMTPSSTSFETRGSKTGYEPQTINPQELQYWRVIRINTNGTVDVVSEYVSSIEVTFKGTPGYANYIGYLNELASFYENSKYTIGSRHMGYNGQTEYIHNPSHFNGQMNYAPWTTVSASNEPLGAGDSKYLTDYNLVRTAYTGTTIYGSNSSGTLKAYKAGTTTATDYWIASRYYSYDDYPKGRNCYFYGRYIDSLGSLRAVMVRVFNFDWNDASSAHNFGYSEAIRPILTLKANITSSSIEEGTGAYILD